MRFVLIVLLVGCGSSQMAEMAPDASPVDSSPAMPADSSWEIDTAPAAPDTALPRPDTSPDPVDVAIEPMPPVDPFPPIPNDRECIAGGWTLLRIDHYQCLKVTGPNVQVTGLALDCKTFDLGPCAVFSQLNQCPNFGSCWGRLETAIVRGDFTTERADMVDRVCPLSCD